MIYTACMIIALLFDTFNTFRFLSELSWLAIVVAAVVVYFFGWLWYGMLFREKYMQLIENKDEKTNWLAMLFQFLGLLVLACLIDVLGHLVTVANYSAVIFFIGVDALIGVTALLLLAGFLFQHGTSRKALHLWLIAGGYEVIAIMVMAVIIWNGSGLAM